MRDVVEIAKDSLSGYDYAHAYGCDPQYPARLIRSLLAEVERLRYDADHFTKQLQDALDPGAGDEWDADDVIAIVRELEAEVEQLKLT